MTANPPNDKRWRELKLIPDAEGYLSFYYSDDLSPLPVRWVTKPGDNKSDPNLETLTYGMFSTCARGMRAGVVKNTAPYIFFFTNRDGQRVLCGYYRIHWFAVGSLGHGDYCLAADKAHFLSDPIRLADIDERLGTQFTNRFRGTKHVPAAQCAQLVELIEQYPDDTELYLREIERLERFNVCHGGFRYVAWRRSEPFSWQGAAAYLAKTRETPVITAKTNTSPTDNWKCRDCKQVTKNKALLKRCPYCGAFDTLQPMAAV